MFRRINNWALALTLLFMLGGVFQSSAQGEALFKANCATCHNPFNDGTGPKLQNVRDAWAEAGDEEMIYLWVNNWKAAAAQSAYAKSITSYSPTEMNLFPQLSRDEIESIFDYVDEQVLPVAAVEEGSTGGSTQDDSGSIWTWVLLGTIFLTIILAVGGVRRQLNNTREASEGGAVNESLTYDEEIRSWAWKNKRMVGVGVLIAVFAGIIVLLSFLYDVGVTEAYHPSQPIQFPHDIHTGKNEIDCKYCHNSVTKSKTAGLPTVNVCMNCHKDVKGSSDEQSKEIAKIYEYAGFDPEGAGAYSGETKPIVWNKVHVLPDHVYFPHDQHVVVGGIDCKQCHGDMTTRKETAQVVSAEDLSAIDGNIKMTKPTLTMGWCIECHSNSEISSGSLDSKKDGYYNEIHKRLMDNDRSLYEGYLEDGKVTVKELGGWECAKCHY